MNDNSSTNAIPEALPVTQSVTGFRVTSAMRRQPTGQDEPVVILQLHVADDGLQPTRTFATSLSVDQALFESMAEKFAQMTGMSRAAFAEHLRAGAGQVKR